MVWMLDLDYMTVLGSGPLETLVVALKTMSYAKKWFYIISREFSVLHL